MAGIQSVAIPGLTWDGVSQKIYYESKTINFIIAFERDVGILNYLVKWIDFDLKIIIKDTSNNVIYSDYSWVRVDENNYKYDTNSNYGKYAIVKASRSISQAHNIGIIEIYCKRGRSSSTEYSKIIDITSLNLFYKNIEINSSNSGYNKIRYTAAVPETIYPSNKCTVSNPGDISVKGCGRVNASYRNSKYHMGALEITFTGVNYLGETVFPDKIEITDGTFSKSFPVGAGNKAYNRILIIDANQQIKSPYWIKYYIGNAVYIKEFSETSGFYPLSAFVEQELILTELNIEAYNILSTNYDGMNYSIIQRSLVQGKIKLKDDNISPYNFNINDKNYYINENIKTAYTFSNNIITLKDNIPFGNQNYSSVSGWENDSFVFFTPGTEYKLKIQVIQRFDSSLQWLEIPISKYINYSAAPLIFTKALNYQISYGEDNPYDNLLILNPKETLKVNINKNYIFFPALQKKWGDNVLDNCNYQIYYDLSNEQNSTISNNSNSLVLNTNYSQTHEQIISGLNTYTKFLKFGLKVTQGSNSIFNPMESIRIGRVQPMKISSCQIKGNVLTYYLSDYGGDKTASIPASTFIPYDSSLSRSGNESLTLIFKDSSGEQLGNLVINTQLLGSKEEARKKFYENVPIKLPLTLWTTNTEIIAKISKIEGVYNYSYSGSNSDQITTFTLESNQIDNVTNNPTLSIRKNGVIINGKPGQELTEVLDDNKNPIGKYYIEINALDNNDRFILKYPNGNCQFEIFNNEGIYISTTNKGITTSASLEDILTIANTFKT